MKKVLIIWLWNQWKKYLEYFIVNKYEIYWVCRTEKTKKYIENKYSIKVDLDIDNILNSHFFNIIIIALPIDIQWYIAISIAKRISEDTKIIIETPVSWNNNDINLLKKYCNIFFFLEEYYSLLWRFLRKVDISKISQIEVNIYISKEEFNNEKSKNINIIHINNNFLWVLIDKKVIKYKFNFHELSNIFYEIKISYNWLNILFAYKEEVFLLIWEKKYKDNISFNNILSNIIEEKSNFSNFFNLDYDYQ